MPNNKNITENKKIKSKYIIPPGLSSRVISFKSHVQVSKGGPILIVGPTGVGKSLFLNIFERLWMKKNPNTPIVWANCAHFGGEHSDPNIARSELFGLKSKILGQNVSTHNIIGLVERANGGVLILEEIGELPLVVQAMLLTFIETGKYRCVGDTSAEEREANLSIIGSTNRETALRDDFRFRFFPFYVPPIYERRGDILFYLNHKYPTIIKTLTPFEILSLLAYNWPGNVREIERVGMLIERGMNIYRATTSGNEDGTVVNEVDRLLNFDPEDTKLDVLKITNFHEDMKRSGINTTRLESLLSSFGLGLSIKNRSPINFGAFIKQETHPFESLPASSVIKDNQIGMEVIIGNIAFQEAFLGYCVLCSLLFQHPASINNTFDLTGEHSLKVFFQKSEYKYGLSEKIFNLYEQLIVQTFVYLSGLNLPPHTSIPFDYSERLLFFADLATKYPSNKFLASFAELNVFRREDTSLKTDIFSLPFFDFMKYYHEELIRRANGIVAEAARRVKVNDKTFRTRLLKYGIVKKSLIS